MCSDSSFSSAFALSVAHTVKRPRPLPPVTANQGSCKEGLPPLPPGGRSRKQGENDDFSIVGSPRRGRLKRLAAKAAKSGERLFINFIPKGVIYINKAERGFRLVARAAKPPETPVVH